MEEAEEVRVTGTGSEASTWCFGDFLASFGAMVEKMGTLGEAQPSFILS
jgi:hypothetical protein